MMPLWNMINDQFLEKLLNQTGKIISTR